MGIVAVSVSQLARFEVILDILAAETYFIANL